MRLKVEECQTHTKTEGTETELARGRREEWMELVVVSSK